MGSTGLGLSESRGQEGCSLITSLRCQGLQMLQQGRMDRNLDAGAGLELVEAQRSLGEVDVFPLNPATVAQSGPGVDAHQHHRVPVFRSPQGSLQKHPEFGRGEHTAAIGFSGTRGGLGDGSSECNPRSSTACLGNIWR